ncbi:hypothetical protein KSP39_PZI000211 [Platanthera zijinensis]|uniref:Uncharacterized protein n=1 Tax=Platanthera zijinensis TaxID=2320716 RepID=A0AAP0C3K5_9ASPA
MPGNFIIQLKISCQKIMLRTIIMASSRQPRMLLSAAGELALLISPRLRPDGVISKTMTLDSLISPLSTTRIFCSSTRRAGTATQYFFSTPSSPSPDRLFGSRLPISSSKLSVVDDTPISSRPLEYPSRSLPPLRCGINIRLLVLPVNRTRSVSLAFAEADRSASIHYSIVSSGGAWLNQSAVSPRGRPPCDDILSFTDKFLSD